MSERSLTVMSADAIADHLEDMRALNRRPGTIYQRRLMLRRLELFARADPLSLEYETLRRFVTRPHLGVEARSAAVTHLRGFYRWALENERSDNDPSHRLRRPRRDRVLPNPMPDEDARLALGSADDPIRQWLHLAAYAGLRACEIAPVRGEDVLLTQRPRLLVIRGTKGGDTTFVPLSALLVPIAVSLPRHGWWFPKGNGRDGHVTPSQVSKRANLYLHGLGISHTLHTLRHWFGTQTFRVTGRDLRATQELLRHRSPVSTAGYTFVDPGETARAVDGLPLLTA